MVGIVFLTKIPNPPRVVVAFVWATALDNFFDLTFAAACEELFQG